MSGIEAITALVSNLGTPVALCIFFVWWSFTRERELARRLSLIEDFARTELAKLIRDTTSALVEFSSSVKLLSLGGMLDADVAKTLAEIRKEHSRNPEH